MIDVCVMLAVGLLGYVLTVLGFPDAITLLATHSPQAPDALRQRIHNNPARRTRTIIDIPYEPALVTGGRYYPRPQQASRRAWQTVAAAVRDVPESVRSTV